MSGLIFHLIPHTHWDREWYLPRAAFQARLLPALDDLIERLQTDAGYRSFLLDGQTVLVADYLYARPERKADLQTLVKTGRLQVGPWYVLADELIPSGEALVRNLLLGAADADQLGGRLDVLYSPDAFGHPASWPTLAREFGIRCGVVWRGLGGEPGQERDLYRWRGPDGRDVLVWHLPPAGYEVGAALPAAADRLAEAWAAIRPVLVERATAKHIPVFLGADHRAAHPAVSRLRDLLAELEPGSAFRVSRLDEFLQLVGEGVKPPPLDGELRWSYRYAWTLQGVHATRAPLKRRATAAELCLERLAEPLAALARRAGGRDRRPLLELAWRTLVRCQFHDAIAGCTSDDVARAVAGRLTSVEALAADVVRGAVFDLVRHDPDAARERAGDPAPALVLWNPAARPRGGVVVVDVTLFRRDVPVGPPSGRAPRQGQGYRPFGLAGPDGRSIGLQLLDRRAGHERLDAARHYPDQDEVDWVRVALRLPALPGLGVTCAGLTPGATRPDRAGEGGVVEGRSPVNRWIEIVLEPTGGLAGAPFRAGARWPLVGRRAAEPLGAPVPTAPAQRVVAAADGRRGLALLGPGFFEYEWTRRGDLVLTLLRSVGELSRGDLPTRPGHAGWPTATPLAQCLGTSRVELAIAPVSQAEVERGDVIPALWEDVFLPVRGFWLRDATRLVPASVDIALEGTGLVVAAVKPAEQGSPMVLRCYNATGRKTAGAWRFGEGVKSAHRVRADERESTALVLEGRGKTVRFVAEPYEIVTILVT